MHKDSELCIIANICIHYENNCRLHTMHNEFIVKHLLSMMGVFGRMSWKSTLTNLISFRGTMPH